LLSLSVSRLISFSLSSFLFEQAQQTLLHTTNISSPQQHQINRILFYLFLTQPCQQSNAWFLPHSFSRSPSLFSFFSLSCSLFFSSSLTCFITATQQSKWAFRTMFELSSISTQ
jgi:hypothetical protein